MRCKLLKLLFYHQYTWQEKVGNNDIAAFSTIAYMGFVATIDLMGLYSLLSLLYPIIKFRAFNGAIMVILSWIVLYFLLEYRYDYKRMVNLAKAVVGKSGKWLWIVCMYVITLLMPIIVCTLWWANNNGRISIS
jgi:hypothetical protein